MQMKELNALELHYLLKELNLLVGGKIDQIYQPEKKELLLSFHIPSVGKKLLRIKVPNYLYLTEFRGDMPETPADYCIFLRRRLINARLREISQQGFERVVELMFEKADSKFYMIIELFSKGNVVLCDDKHVIISPLEIQKWKDRTIMPKLAFKFPQRDNNFLTLTFEQLANIVEKSDKENIVKTIAIELGLGGTYAEELCLIAGIDKSKKKIDDKEVKSLFKAVEQIREMVISPCIIGDAVTPFALIRNKSEACETAGSYNEALDKILSVEKKGEIKEKGDSGYQKKVAELKRIIGQQELKLKQAEKSITEDKQKAELIYEHYQKIDLLLSEMKKAREKHSFKEIKEMLKNSKLVKEINEKDKTITIEI